MPRTDPAHEAAEETLRSLEQRIAREYGAALDDVRGQMAGFLERFERQDRAYRKRVEGGSATEAQYRAWRRDQVMDSDRFRALVKKLSEDLTRVAGYAMGIVNGELPDLYAEGMNYGTFEVERGTTVETAFTLYDRSTVTALLRDQPYLYPSAAVNKSRQRRWDRRHITSVVTQGLLTGAPMDRIAASMERVVGMDAAVAARAARTCVTAAENSGRVDSYRRAERLGIKVRKQWLATLDGRTRSSHRELDGESAEVEEAFSNGLMYPGDPSGPGAERYNCRCTLVADLAEFPAEQVNRASRLGDMTYEEWRAEHVERTIAPPAPSTSPVPVRYGEFRGLSYVDDSLGAHAGDGSDLDPVRMVAEDTGFDDARARQAIRDVSQWVGNDYTRIRAHDPSTEDVRERLEEFLKASPKYEGTVWRGVGLERADAEDVLQALRTGGEIDQRGVSSWATESDWATEFAGMNVEIRNDGVSIVFRLDENRSGVSIKHVASIDNDEVVAPEGVRYVLSGEIEWVEDPYDGDYWLVPVREVY